MTGFAGRVVLKEPHGQVPAPFSMEVEEQADRLWPHKPGVAGHWRVPGSQVYGPGWMSGTLHLTWGSSHLLCSVLLWSAVLQVLETQRIR